MTTQLTLHEVHEDYKVYVYSESTKVRGEVNCTRSKSYGVTVHTFSDGSLYIFRTGIYNMVTGSNRYIKKVAENTLKMIAENNFKTIS